MIKKIIILLLILITILNTCFTLVVNAQVQEVHLQKIRKAPYHLKYYREESGLNLYLECSIVGYYQNGKFYPAYCMNRNLNGAETSEYNVDISKKLENDSIWRVIKNGYPYKTASQMGLSSDYDAYMVTKMAVYCMLGQAEISYFSADSNDAEAIQMLSVLKNLVNIGNNNSEVQINKYFNLERNGNIQVQEDNYIQSYKILNAQNCNNVEISSLNPEINLIKIDNSNFNVLIPKEKMNKDIDIKINISAEVENYPVFYGKTYIYGTQDYAVTYERNSRISENFEDKIVTNLAKIKIKKVDEETKVIIPNTEFELLNENKEVIQKKKTSENGELTFENLYKGKYYLKETKVDEKYILNEKEIEINLNFNEQKYLEIKNKCKKGNLKIFKYDKDSKKLSLGGIEFELYDDNNNLVGNYKTDLNGQINIENLPIGKYILKEKQAKNGYELAENIELEIKWNETTNLEISNEKQKGKIKIIKVDKENNELKIEGAKFNLLDENGKILEELVTDKKGEAISENYSSYNEKYYLQEIEANPNYKLNKEKIEIEIKPYIINEFVIENEVKKGRIEIEKLDFDELYPLENVEFDIINNKTQELVEHLKTNKDGKALSKYLPIIYEYKIKETSKLDNYKVNDSEILVKLKGDEKNKVTITNEKEKVEEPEEPSIPIVPVEEVKKLPVTGY